jgi:hypothetical protein
MIHFAKILMALLVLASPAGLIRAADAEEDDDASTKPAIEFPSPDGKFAFRYSGEKSKDDDEDAKQTYDLIDAASGKVVRTVAKSNPEIGPSARFEMEVLWRPDSKAFALTATLWKRGSSLFVFMKQGATFREVKVPELVADVPKKAKGGKSFEHVNQLNSESATSWEKDGSLVAESETILDGEDGTLTVNRTVVLGFNQSNKARILKSTVKFDIEK